VCHLDGPYILHLTLQADVAAPGMVLHNVRCSMASVTPRSFDPKAVEYKKVPLPTAVNAWSAMVSEVRLFHELCHKQSLRICKSNISIRFSHLSTPLEFQTMAASKTHDLMSGKLEIVSKQTTGFVETAKV
jgi:hypothetical protein